LCNQNYFPNLSIFYFINYFEDSSVFSSTEDSSFVSSVFGASLGASCKAFKDKPILFFSGSKLIILAVTSSPTLI
jgi:hypothetical protein